jgi:hypothetical protein
MEIWLHPNRRILAISLVPAGAIAAVGTAIARVADGRVLEAVGAIVALVGVGLAAGLALQMLKPRIAFDAGSVLFNLRAGRPVAVPVETVEAFFLGQGPAGLPVISSGPPETVNLVAKLSQKSPEWARVEVKPALGHWCDHYVTIQGAWCEPLVGDVVRRLNRRLREVQEARSAPQNSRGDAP